MSGWQQQVEQRERPTVWVPPKGVIGIVVAQKFPDPVAIRTTLEDGFARVAPDTVWVMRENARKDHAVSFAWQTFKSNDIEPLLSPLVPAWKREGRTWKNIWAGPDSELWPVRGYDLRADWRDMEMRATCERIIVFHDMSSNITKSWADYRDGGSAAKIFVVERGKVKVKKYRKGRKPD